MMARSVRECAAYWHPVCGSHAHATMAHNAACVQAARRCGEDKRWVIR